jgi:hypothetical protein
VTSLVPPEVMETRAGCGRYRRATTTFLITRRGFLCALPCSIGLRLQERETRGRYTQFPTVKGEPANSLQFARPRPQADPRRCQSQCAAQANVQIAMSQTGMAANAIR